MSNEEQTNIIAPLGIIVGFIILNAFNKQVIYAGKLLLYAWNQIT